MSDRIVGVCRYCRAPVRQADVDEGTVELVLWTPEGGGLYSHANTACIPKDKVG
jgi:hypothetical protein